jgi:hypothetical protein
MANTSTLDSKARKAAKRAARKELRGLYKNLTAEQKSKLRRARADKKVGIKAFLASEKKADA